MYFILKYEKWNRMEKKRKLKEMDMVASTRST